MGTSPFIIIPVLNHDGMKTVGGVEVYLHAFSSSALDGDRIAPGETAPNLGLCRKSNTDSSIVQPVA
jgi:hypothetical protein